MNDRCSPRQDLSYYAAKRTPPAAAALPALHLVRLLDQLRERIELLHYCLRTEEAAGPWRRAMSVDPSHAATPKCQ
jgi:hypothetical protein